MDIPRYTQKPIFSLQSLSLRLGESPALLAELARNSHNLYRLVPQQKKDGSVRETFDAHQPLKSIQRKIVDRIFSCVIYPSYLHGGIRDVNHPRSIYSNVACHSGARFVVMQDIKNFFPSISEDKVLNIFKGVLGFGDEVSILLAKLTTRKGEVPQGASTSSYLSNLVFWDVEPRLVRWAKANNLAYSRFADDITISSKVYIDEGLKTDIIRKVTGMLASKGFYQKRSKMHALKKGQVIVSKGKKEPFVVTGLAVSGPKPGVAKSERKKIRAAVKEFENLANSGAFFEDIEGKFNSAMGRVGRLIACNQPEGVALKERLNAARYKANTPLLERYLAGKLFPVGKLISDPN